MWHEHERRSAVRWRLQGEPQLLRRRHTRLEQEIAAGASSSRTVEIAGGTADSAVVAEDTPKGVQIVEDVGFGEPDPPPC